MLRRSSLGLLAGVALALLAGCSSGPVIGGKPRVPATMKVVSLSPATTELTSKFDLGMGVVGKTANCNYPPTLNSTAQIVMSGTAPDYEKIASIKPDIVIYDKTLFSENEIAKIDQMGFKTLAWDPKTFEEYRTQLFVMASEIGGEMTTSEYIDSIYRGFAQAKGVLKEKGIVDPPMMILIGEPGSYMAPGTKSFWADLAADCGTKLVGPDAAAYAPVNVELIIKEAPQFILTSEGVGAKVLADPRLQGVPAVKSKRVFDINPDVLVRRGIRVDSLIDSFNVAIGKLPTQAQ